MTGATKLGRSAEAAVRSASSPSRGRHELPALSVDRRARRTGPGSCPPVGPERGQAHVRRRRRQHRQPGHLPGQHRRDQGRDQEGKAEPNRGPGQPAEHVHHRAGGGVRRDRRGAVAVDGAEERPGQELGTGLVHRPVRAGHPGLVRRGEPAQDGARPDLPGADLAGGPGRGRLPVAQGIDRFLQATALRVTADMTAAPVVLSAVPTLFDADGEVDPGANQALYKLVAGLVDGLLVAGTTGEFPALEDAERLSLFELALAEAGPDRVIAHIGAPDARHAIRLARAAVTLGATRIAAITPYYLPARPGALAAHDRRLHQ